MAHQSVETVVAEAIREARWVTWGRFRDHLGNSMESNELGRLIDPYTFVMARRYLGYWLIRLEESMEVANGEDLASIGLAVERLIGETFLNNLLDCFWASYVLRDAVSEFFALCSRHNLPLEYGYKRLEYNIKGWEAFENVVPENEGDAKWHKQLRSLAAEIRGEEC